MNRRRTLILAVLPALAVTVAGPARAQSAGLDPAVDARVKTDFEAIRQADANRKLAFLRQDTPDAARYQILQEARDVRTRASLDAVQALFPVRASMAKDPWKALVAQLAVQPPHALLAEQALKELPAVVPDETRRKPAEKALKELVSAAKDNDDDREAGRKKIFALLEKPTSTLEDFVTVLAKYSDKQAKLDDKLVAASDVLQRALNEAEWQELVRRISKPVAGGSGPG